MVVSQSPRRRTPLGRRPGGAVTGAPGCSGRKALPSSWSSAGLGCGQMGSTLMGPLQKNMYFGQIGEKGTPWHFGKYKSRLTGVPQKGPSGKKPEICSDPIRADPIRPSPMAAEVHVARPGELLRQAARLRDAPRGPPVLKS